MKTAPTNRPASKLPRAIALSITAMLAMNVFVLAQQLQTAPALALAATASQLA